MDNPVVFLGGTCNNDPWREKAMEILDQEKVPYFNPVVEDWNEAAQKREEAIKREPGTIQLYVITSKMTGVFSIAEVVASVHKDPQRTVLGLCMEGFEEGQWKSLKAVGQLVTNRGGMVCTGKRDAVISGAAHLASSTWRRAQERAKEYGGREKLLTLLRRMKSDGVIFIPKTDYRLLGDMIEKAGRIRNEKAGCNYEHMMLQPLGAMYSLRTPESDEVMAE